MYRLLHYYRRFLRAQTTSRTLDVRQAYLLKIATGLAVLVVAMFCVKVAQMLWQSSQSMETDLGAYFDGAFRLRAGLPLYRSDINLDDLRLQFIYPPPLALLFLPWQTYQLAWWAWAACSIASWSAALALLLRELRSDLGERLQAPLWWPILIAALVNFPPTLAHLIWGQLQLLILLLVTISWLCLRRRRDITAGVLIGLAIALKLYPCVLLVPLVIQRRWSSTVAALGTSAGVLALSFVAVGWEQIYVYFSKVLPEVSRLSADRLDTYSIGTTLRIALGDAALANQISLLLRLVIFGMVVFAMTRLRGAPDRALSLGVTLLLVITPVIWAHYFVLAYLPWLETLSRAPRRQLPLLVAAYFLIAMASLIFYVPPGLVATAQAMPVLGALLLLSIQLWGVFRQAGPLTAREGISENTAAC
jgi:alpha-1,2-mannosyltransferase